ncbi:MAG: ABC transporter permease [Verrucomicrobiales bacterium]|nr:ABC transporter permease [Verrucomicrobiales bacterium]
MRREIGAFFMSPVSHVIFALFNLVMGFSFWFCAAYMGQGVRNITVMQVFFMIFYFWFCLIIMIPIFTMRLFAEEYKSGTIELLMSAPVLEWDVILSKFFACAVFYAGLWFPTLFYLSAYQTLTAHQVPVEWGALAMSYLLVLLIGLFYIAVGLFTSSLTKNQVLASFASFVIIALLFFAGFLGFTLMGSGPGAVKLVDYVATLRHMQLFAGGVFDSRPVVFYLSGTGLFLFLTYIVISLRKLRS